MSALAYRDCPGCHSSAVSNLAKYQRDDWKIGSCTACDFVFLRNPVDYEALEEDFAWETTFETERSHREKKRGPLKRFAQKARNLHYRLRGDSNAYYLKILGAGRVLDIGCGYGERLKPPFVPHGIELSKAQATRADVFMRSHGGYCVHGAGAEAIWDLPENDFDTVMMHSYLEHEVDFARVLRGAMRCLRPGGRVYIRVPNFAAINRWLSGANWSGFRYPDHVNYFTPKSLRTAIEQAGMDFKHLNRKVIWLDDNIKALAIKPAQI